MNLVPFLLKIWLSPDFAENRRIKEQRHYERLAATTQLSLGFAYK